MGTTASKNCIQVSWKVLDRQHSLFVVANNDDNVSSCKGYNSTTEAITTTTNTKPKQQQQVKRTMKKSQMKRKKKQVVQAPEYNDNDDVPYPIEYRRRVTKVSTRGGKIRRPKAIRR